MLKKNPFGHYLFLKKLLIRSMGCLTHRRYRGFNQLQIEGSDIIRDLPNQNVLFVSMDKRKEFDKIPFKILKLIEKLE